MAWIYYKKAYDMVPHSWNIECLDLFGVAEFISEQYGKVEGNAMFKKF